MKITLIGLPEGTSAMSHVGHRLMDAAASFIQDYPDRVGRRHGVVYSWTEHGELRCHVYRTAAGTVIAKVL